MKLLHGGDYNPEQWLDRPDILVEDMRLMKEARINTVTLGVFSWSSYEPEEGHYQFEWLDEIIDTLYKNGIYTILATPSGGRPAWLDEAYPEVLRVSDMGVRNLHGVRHNHCMSSPRYREKVRGINNKLAHRYGGHPGLLMWHISNELGGACYCDLCKKKFQEFLKDKYDHNIDLLNKEWWTTFWSHQFNRFEQIDPPSPRGEGSITGLKLDWKRFTSWNMTDYMKSEILVFKALTPKIPVTTNFMCLYPGLNYYELAEALDVVAWDNYPKWHNEDQKIWETAFENAFDHAVMRSLKKGKPYLLMESVPSQVNWHPYNKLKRPGIHRLSCLQAVACGSDSVLYFQWRKSRGSYEQYHGAVIDHLGSSDTRVFKEVEEVGRLLTQLDEICGTVVKSKVAMYFDWENRWAIEDMPALSNEKKYPETCRLYYKSFLRMGIDMDIVSCQESLDNYQIVIAPMLYLLKPSTAEHIKKFVKNGGTLLATYLTGYVNENTLCYLGGFPGDGLREVFGLYSEEIDVLYPRDHNSVRFVVDNFLKGSYRVKEYCELLKTESAKILAVYAQDFYEGTPAITVNSYGKGKAYYVGARLDEVGMSEIFKKVCSEVGVLVVDLPEGVQMHKRTDGVFEYKFYLNAAVKEQVIPIGVTETVMFASDTLSTRADAESSQQWVLKPNHCLICKSRL